MATHRKSDPDPLDRRVPAKESADERAAADHVGSVAVVGPTSWYRSPRNLAVLILALAAVIGGAFLVVNRDSGQSKSGSATAQISTGINKTLADYFAASNITQTPVGAGEAGVPVIGIPLPQGWSDAGPDTRPGVFAEWLYDDAANPDNVPFVDFLFSRLDGAPDPAKVLEFAPGELRNLPDYQMISEPAPSQLDGFEAVVLEGLYTQNWQERIIAQKTVVIPSAEGLFVLQMNANAPKDEALVVQQVTAMIDERASIEP